MQPTSLAVTPVAGAASPLASGAPALTLAADTRSVRALAHGDLGMSGIELSRGMVGVLRLLAMLAFLSMAASGFSGEQSEPEGTQADSLNVSLHVEPPGEPAVVGAYTPFIVTLRNAGRSTVTVIQPGDGSKWGMRTPFVGWSMIPVGEFREHPGSWPGPLQHPRCGNMNGLWMSDIVTLEPGETETLSSWCHPLPFTAPGEYRAVMYYWNRPDLEPSRPGWYPDDLVRLIRASAPLELKSNEVLVTVVEGAQQAP